MADGITGQQGGWATMRATCTLSHKIKDNHYFSKIAHKSLACSLYRSPRKCIKIRYVCAREIRRERVGVRGSISLCVGNAPANGNSRNRNKVYVTLRIRSVAYEYMHARMQRLS